MIIQVYPGKHKKPLVEQDADAVKRAEDFLLSEETGELTREEMADICWTLLRSKGEQP